MMRETIQSDRDAVPAMIGTAQFIVTQPRELCFKFGIRLGRSDIIKPFARSGRTVFYLAIEKTGDLGAGDKIEFLSREQSQPSISEVVRRRFNLSLHLKADSLSI